MAAAQKTANVRAPTTVLRDLYLFIRSPWLPLNRAFRRIRVTRN